jgi:signal transduction histidine kinase
VGLVVLPWTRHREYKLGHAAYSSRRHRWRGDGRLSTGSGDHTLQTPLWWAIAVFRVASLGYAAVVVAASFRHYRHPGGGWAVVVVMAAWTVTTVAAYASAERQRPWLFVADVVVGAGCLLATGAVETPERLAAGAPNLTMSWVAASVMACGVAGGRWRGTLAGAVLAACDVGLHHRLGHTLNGAILLLFTGFVAGHVGMLTRDAEVRLARAVEMEAATRERERLARRIHDSVLQVLALVKRRGLELGDEAAELGRLAGEQEAALRALIRTRPGHDPGEADLRELLAAYASTGVSLSAPATPVPLPGYKARELAAAVGAALDNVRRHCGATARAWVFLEEDAGDVVVSVRDDGPGIPPGRLAAAAADGRLGVAQAILGRIHDLGGAAEISSRPGEGTEIELRIPAG